MFFWILRTKTADHLILKTMIAKEIRYGKIWSTHKTIETTMERARNTRMTRCQPVPCTKSLAQDDVVYHGFIERKIHDEIQSCYQINVINNTVV